jgi:hypothetical protein
MQAVPDSRAVHLPEERRQAAAGDHRLEGHRPVDGDRRLELRPVAGDHRLEVLHRAGGDRRQVLRRRVADHPPAGVRLRARRPAGALLEARLAREAATPVLFPAQDPPVHPFRPATR